MSVCKTIITRSRKILESTKYSIMMHCSWIDSKFTEFDERVRQFWVHRDNGLNQFANDGMLYEANAVEVSTVVRLERLCRIQSSKNLIGWFHW
jgi:hypothetical protein